MRNRYIFLTFYFLCLLTLLTPFWAFSELLFPYVTSKAFYFRILVEAALPFYCYLVFTEKNLRPKLSSPINVLLLSFFAINIITAFTGLNPSRSLWGNFERMGGVWYLLHLIFWAYYIQLVAKAGEKYLKWFLRVFIAVGVTVTLNGISGWLHGPMLTPDLSLPDRVSSTFGNPIFFASAIILPFVLSLYLAVKERILHWRIIYWVAAFVQLFGIYLSGTRGAAVGLIAGFVFGIAAFIFFSKNKRLRIYLLAILVISFIGWGSLYANKSRISQESKLYRIVNLIDRNGQARLLQWQIAWQGFKQYPVLGVGSENYYVIFDSFYNPEMYKYDASWFDKPHNYLLEVLVTNGVFGLGVYLAIFLLAIYGFFKAFKSGVIDLISACLFAAGLVAYQVQNFFVFDTVSASVAFFGFLGLASFVGYESLHKSENVAIKENYKPVKPYAFWLFFVFCCLMLFVEYASNFASMRAAKAVNFGMAYSGRDPVKAAEYFEFALNSKYNLDQRESIGRYSDFAAKLLSAYKNGQTENINEEFVVSQMEKITKRQELIAKKYNNDPLAWMHLAADQMNLALLKNTDLSIAQPSVDKAISLSPNRAELWQLEVQLQGYKKNWPGVVLAAKKIVELNPYKLEVRWQLAMAYYLNGQISEAVKTGDEVIALGYKFTQLQQFAWYAQYYQEQENWSKMVPLLEQALSLEPNEIGLYVDLAKAYANLGEKEQAELLAKQVISSDPTRQAEMEKFIKSLK